MEVAHEAVYEVQRVSKRGELGGGWPEQCGDREDCAGFHLGVVDCNEEW